MLVFTILLLHQYLTNMKRLLFLALLPLLSFTTPPDDERSAPPMGYCYTFHSGHPSVPTLGYYVWLASVTSYYAAQNLHPTIVQTGGSSPFEICYAVSLVHPN